MEYCKVESVHRFKTHYVRNNRRSTEKNLRCFPCCNADGHVTQGFCGRGCLFRVTLSPDSSLNLVPPHNLHCVVELTMCDDMPANMPVVGQTYTTADMWSRLKTSGEPEPWTRQYWKGTQQQKSNFTTTTTTTTTSTSISTTSTSTTAATTNTQQPHVVDFIFTPTHWHYGWRSNKHTNKSRHTCRIYVFREDEEGTLLCIGSTNDGAFTISSTKKKSPEIPPGEMVAPVGADALPEYGKLQVQQQHKRKQTQTKGGDGKKESRTSGGGGGGAEKKTTSKVRQPKKKRRRKTGSTVTLTEGGKKGGGGGGGGGVAVEEDFLRTPPLSGEHSPRTQAAIHMGSMTSDSKRSVSNDSSGGAAEEITEAFQVLSSMGLPSAFNSDENSWDQKRLSSSGAFYFIFYSFSSSLFFFFFLIFSSFPPLPPPAFSIFFF